MLELEALKVKLSASLGQDCRVPPVASMVSEAYPDD